MTALQRLFVNALPQEMQGSTSPRTAAEQYVQNYIAEYEAEIKPYIKKRKHRDEGWMNYETIIHSKNLYNANRFWGFSIECYSFTGGAHGMTTTSYTVVDLNSGKALSLNDLFAESDYNLISRMLRQQLADDLGTTVDKLGEKSYEADNIGRRRQLHDKRLGHYLALQPLRHRALLYRHHPHHPSLPGHCRLSCRLITPETHRIEIIQKRHHANH